MPTKRFSILLKDDCYHKPQPFISPDRADLCLRYNRGEFSEGYDMGFKRHLERLITLNHDPYFTSFNGSKQREITRVEPLWL